MRVTTLHKGKTPLVVALHKAVFAMDRVADRLLAERFGLTLSQFMILLVLGFRPGTTQKAIADARGLTEAAVSRTIDLLAQKGLLTRKVNPASRRERILVLTAQGRDLAAKAERATLAKIEESFEVLSKAERKVLERAVGKLLAAFSDGKSPFCEENC